MPSAPPTPSADKFSAPLDVLKGVGPTRLRVLAELGLSTLGELLYHFPRDWQNRRETSLDAEPFSGGLAVLKGRVLKARFVRAGQNLGLLKAQLSTGEAQFSAVWFKHLSRRYDVFASLKKQVVPGADIWVVGRSEPNLLGPREIHAEECYETEDPEAGLHVGRLTPVYPLTEGLDSRHMREWMRRALDLACGAAREIVPASLMSRRELLAVSQALRGIHFPGSPAELNAARGRLAYEELLLLELACLLKRRQINGVAKGYGYEVKRRLLTPFRNRLGFELTAAQKRVINEIFADLERPRPMTRLLQGDVGSGKTVVALSALLLAVENGYQGAFMAPTEILAEQHFLTLTRFLEGLPVRLGLLTSGVPAKERKKTALAARAGELDILIGTHALLEDDVGFAKLRLAVIDEQHRFGVRQRATLRAKGHNLDLLVMTATPIPRTLALSLYGDLDVSTLDELPPGKTTARTILSSENEALAEIKKQVALGRQGYIVYPIISESSRLELKAAKAEFERLKAGALAGLRLELIHGRIPGPAKARIMSEFAAGRLDALVATQVIEVGIDVPNATVMVIQNAERFGLASLHQLRGRIGRGQAASSCFLVADPSTPEARRRIEILAGCSDGFRIGEEDLKLRGPGEMLGMAQHGELELKVADIFKDAELLTWAREDAAQILEQDARLQAAGNAGLRDKLIKLYQSQWNWIDLE